MSETEKSIVPDSAFADPFAGRGQLAEREALEFLLRVATQVSALHDAGHIHRQIDASGCDQLGSTALSLPPAREFGGTFADIESCPPELQHAPVVSLPADLDQARQLLAARNISMPPERIDVYQLGALLCRKTTGESVASYLKSPSAKGKLRPLLQAAIDGALGYDPATRHRTVHEFIDALEAIIQRGFADAGDTDRIKTDNSGDTDVLLADAANRDCPDDSRADAASLELPFQRLAHYEVQGRIGHGGMGDVYKAYERSLDRVVAIKVLPADFARQPEFVDRFRAEATAVASITHPNVVQIYFIGEDQGYHFFAMQFVEGESLADLLNRRGRRDVDETLAIIEQVLAGLNAAHQQNVVHRDIKPANVLIDRVHRRVLVADFGLVKSIQASEQITATGVVMGTVDYISPEQGRGHPVDARSDLYCVGVMTYQLLSGQLPFTADSPTAMIFQHVYESPPSLKERCPRIPDGICEFTHRLMHKSPDARYQGAQEALDALRAIRAGQPVNVSSVPRSPAAVETQTAIIAAPQFSEPASLPEDLNLEAPLAWWERTQQWLFDFLRRRSPEFADQLQNTQQQVDGAVAEYEDRRNQLQGLVTEAEDVLAQLERQADDYRQAVNDAQRREDVAGHDSDIQEALQEKATAEDAVSELSAQVEEQTKELETIQLRLAQVNATLATLAGQRDLLNARLKMARAQIDVAAAKPPSLVRRRVKSLAFALVVVLGGVGLILAAVFVVPSRFLHDRSTGLPPPPQSALEVTIGGDGECIVPLESTPSCIVFLPKPVATLGFGFAVAGTDGTISQFQPRRNGAVQQPRLLVAHDARIHDLVFSPDGTRLATASEDRTVRIWEAQGERTRRELRRFEHDGAALAVQFSADAKHVLSASASGTLHLWDVLTESKLKTAQLGEIRSKARVIAWCRDGARVLIGAHVRGADSMSIWDFDQNAEAVVFDTDKRGTTALALSLSQQEAYALNGGSIYVRDLQTGDTIRQFGTGIDRAAFAPAAYRAWSADENQILQLWDVRDGSVLATYSSQKTNISHVAISADGATAISASKDSLSIWDLNPPPPPKGQLRLVENNAPVTTVGLSNDGTLVLANSENDVTLWNVEDGHKVRDFRIRAQVPSAVFSPDGRSVLYGTAQSSGVLGLGDIVNNSSAASVTFNGHEGPVTCVAQARAEKHVFSGSSDGTVRVWNALTGKEIAKLELGKPINDIAVDSQGMEVLIGANDNVVRRWSWNQGSNATELTGHTSRVTSVAFSPDGSHFASASTDRSIRVWDAATRQLVVRLQGHAAPVNDVVLSTHGLAALSGGDDATVRLWDVTSGMELQRFEGHLGPVRAVAMDAGGTRAVSGSDDATLRVWSLPLVAQ